MRPSDTPAHPAPGALAHPYPGRGVPAVAVLSEGGIGVGGQLRDDSGVLPVQDRGRTPRRGAGSERAMRAELAQIALDARETDGETGGDLRLAHLLFDHRPHDTDTQIFAIGFRHADSIAPDQSLCNPL